MHDRESRLVELGRQGGWVGWTTAIRSFRSLTPRLPRTCSYVATACLKYGFNGSSGCAGDKGFRCVRARFNTSACKDDIPGNENWGASFCQLHPNGLARSSDVSGNTPDKETRSCACCPLVPFRRELLRQHPSGGLMGVTCNPL